MFKFANDRPTNLIITQITDVTAEAEIMNIKLWAFLNKMEMSWDNTNEMVAVAQI
jgi:hypothetical protein